MRKIQNVLLASILIIALMGFVAYVLRQLSSTPPQVQRLPDGRVARLEAVTYGEKTTVTIGPFGLVRVSTDNGTVSASDPLAFCLSLSNGNWEPYLSTRDIALDEHGCWMDLGSGGRGVSSDQSFLGFEFNRSVKIVHLPAFPRRGSKVILRLYDNKGGGKIAEFSAPNPTPGPHPTWTPESFPITRREDDLAFSLTKLKLNMSYDEKAVPHYGLNYRAFFVITRRDKSTREWAPVSVKISDATGNLISQEIYSPLNKFHYEKGEVFIDLDRGLCFDEVWKLNVEFARTELTHFAPEELWIIGNLQLPQRNSVALSTENTFHQGMKLRLVGIGGPGIREWTTSQSASGEQRAEVRARISLPCEGVRLNLFARDDRGRRFTGVVTGYTDIPSDREREFSFSFSDIPPDAKSLDLTFAIHKSRYAEFLAKPVAPKPAGR
jgi:hypothetical protein